MITVASAPGKLFLVGEYAVVEPGNPAVLVAINRFVTVRLIEAQQGMIWSSQQAERFIPFERIEERLIFPANNPYLLVSTALQLVEQYAKEKGCVHKGLYHVEIVSDLDESNSGRKYGLGSSGAVTVAVVKALLSYYGLEVTPTLVYKLAVITQMNLSMTGSFGDIAASSFGSCIAYRSFNRIWLKKQLESQTLATVLALDWLDLQIDSLVLPASLNLLVGWTGQVVRTEQMLQQTQHPSSTTYSVFLAESKRCVEQFIQACKSSDSLGVKCAVSLNRRLLRSFAQDRGIRIETPVLQRLCDIAESNGAAAKSSGAGGGDCGICFVETLQQKRIIHQAWEDVGIVPLSLEITPA